MSAPLREDAGRAMPDVSVVICAFSSERWDDLVDAVRSVAQQTAAVRDTIVVIDHNPALFQRARAELDALVVENTRRAGASGARNTGASLARGAVIAFLDDDAEAYPYWVESLMTACGNAAVLGVGGTIEPSWTHSEPGWFPPEFAWVVGGTYRGLPTQAAPVRNLWAGNMSVRADVFAAVGGFRDGFGKVGTRARPEDTDFCIRASQMFPDRYWLFEPSARIRHKVPPGRATWRYFVSRCFAEGRGKAELVALVGMRAGLSTEGHHTAVTLPRGLVQALREGRPLRALAIVAGLVVACAGYLRGLLHVLFSAESRQSLSEAGKIV